jgi:hypothetical protein
MAGTEIGLMFCGISIQSNPSAFDYCILLFLLAQPFKQYKLKYEKILKMPLVEM